MLRLQQVHVTQIFLITQIQLISFGIFVMDFFFNHARFKYIYCNLQFEVLSNQNHASIQSYILDGQQVPHSNQKVRYTTFLTHLLFLKYLYFIINYLQQLIILLRIKKIKLFISIIKMSEKQLEILKETRHNYSRYGELCDRNFYELSETNQTTPKSVSFKFKQRKNNLTSSFTSVSRQKKANLRFTIRLPHGQFNYHPQHLYGLHRNPSWSFSQTQRYGKETPVDYQICHKNIMMAPLTQHKPQLLTSSARQKFKDKVRLTKNTSFDSTERKTNKNYSIIGGRQTSAVGFFHKTKIQKPIYIPKEALTKIECQIQADRPNKRQPCPKGYIEFYKKRARQPNHNSKKFETFLKNYDHEKQYQNFSLTQYPISPHHHIDFNQHLQRKDLFNTNKFGPNPQQPKFNFTRPAQNKIDLNLSKFRSTVRTRYDRIEPQANTRLDYDLPKSNQYHLVSMSKTLPRKQELFPIVDTIIKKPGDEVMKLQLKEGTHKVEINQALAHRHYELKC